MAEAVVALLLYEVGSRRRVTCPEIIKHASAFGEVIVHGPF
jgi:hypothetical protein